MQLKDLLILIHTEEYLLRHVCKVPKQYRILIPTAEIYRILVGYSPSKNDLRDLELWADDLAYWLKILKSLPTNILAELTSNRSQTSMIELQRRETVIKQIRKMFSDIDRPKYLRISYAKAQKLATYCENNQLDYLGIPIIQQE